MINLKELTIKSAISSLQKKEYSALELTESYIAAIKKNNPELNAYVDITEQYALNQANISDSKISKNEARFLEGVPIAVKDLFCTKGIRTTSCSNILKDFIPGYESTVTTNLFANGGIMIGKTNMDEFAMGSANITSCFGPVNGPLKNPEGEYVVPGGSSGGSAAAVAADIALGALGSDTGGSVRQPASFTGLVGLKPSYGRCSRFGMISFASSLDQAGVLTKTVEDSALLLQSIMSHDDKDSTCSNNPIPNLMDAFKDKSIKGMKIAIPREYRVEGLPKEIENIWQESIDFLRKEGAIVDEVSLPNTKNALSVYYIIAPAEASSNLARYDGLKYGHRVDNAGSLDDMYFDTRTLGFGAEVKRRIMIGTYVLSSEQYDKTFLQAQRVRGLIINDFQNIFNQYDVIVAPTCISDAFTKDKKLTPLEMYMNDIFTIPPSLAGLPCISVPTKLSSQNLPLGIQIIGNNFEEVKTLKIAKFLESCFGFNKNVGEF
jgi:aspartyl-tRNA(Asn)/glutamyl-tRNA(Gln) amidotransferase subunit A